MLQGIDISHHNQNMKNLQDLNSLDFVIMKATEGIRFKDPALQRFCGALNKDHLRGFYHFARPDLGNDPEDEALHFLKTVHPYLNGLSVLALDVEAGALNVKNIDMWCSMWMQIVEIETGILPMIYTSISETKKFSGVADLGCGLWAAKWGKKPTAKQLEPWKFYAIWQYTSSGSFSGVRVDEDIFNGNRDQFIKYCGVING